MVGLKFILPSFNKFLSLDKTKPAMQSILHTSCDHRNLSSSVGSGWTIARRWSLQRGYPKRKAAYYLLTAFLVVVIGFQHHHR